MVLGGANYRLLKTRLHSNTSTCTTFIPNNHSRYIDIIENNKLFESWRIQHGKILD